MDLQYTSKLIIDLGGKKKIYVGADSCLLD